LEHLLMQEGARVMPHLVTIAHSQPAIGQCNSVL
jgi:hypothetical protein